MVEIKEEILDEKLPKRTIKLTLNDTEGNQIDYEIKRHIPLGKLLESYCKSKNKNSKSLMMIIGGAQVDLHSSCDDLNLDDGTEINVVSRQVGGCFYIDSKFFV